MLRTSSSRRRRTGLVVAITTSALVAATASPAAAQASPFAIPEGRLTFVGADAPAVLVGGGVSLGRTGYTRVSLVVGGGQSWKDTETRSAFHADGVIRFYLDPYRNSPWGVYGAGGLSALYDGFNDWRALLTLGAGVELPSRGRASWAFEVGLGGGVRVALALRHAPARHR